MYVKEAIKNYLKENGYDGLVWYDDTTGFIQCECWLDSDNFMHCAYYWNIVEKCQIAKKFECLTCKYKNNCWDKENKDRTSCLIPV